MPVITKGIYYACFGVILIFLFFHNTFGQMSNADKDFLEQKLDLKFENPSLYSACAVLSANGIPIGLEEIANVDISKYDRIVRFEGGTLREILDSIVKQEPNYIWEFRDGVINLYPVKSRDEILKSLSEIKIKSFSSKKYEGRVGIWDKILSLKEVNALLSSKQIQLSSFTKAWVYVKDATTDIDVSNTDLRSLLNKVVFDSGDSKFWTIQRMSDGNILLTF